MQYAKKFIAFDEAPKFEKSINTLKRSIGIDLLIKLLILNFIPMHQWGLIRFHLKLSKFYHSDNAEVFVFRGALIGLVNFMHISYRIKAVKIKETFWYEIPYSGSRILFRVFSVGISFKSLSVLTFSEFLSIYPLLISLKRDQ